MADNLTTISSGLYDIYSKILDLAAAGEYITTQSNFADIDFLKTGPFGYITEGLALLFQESSFHKTMIYRENFLYTAIMPKSIYNWAKMFNINVIDATPSLRYAEITISTDVIDSIIQKCSGSVASYKIKYGISEASNFMVLDKSNPISAGSYTFSFEHSIEIYKNSHGKYIVKYCLNEQDKTTNFGTYSDGGIINTSYIISGTTKYLTFKAMVAQYKVVEQSKIITGSSFQDIKVHTFDYSGQLCGMALTYSKGSSTENVDLKFSNIDRDEDMTSETKVAYYSLIDGKTVEVAFTTNRVAGLPQSGGTLTLKTFITEGFNGNISYSGDAVFIIKQDDFKSLPISVSLVSDIYSSGKDQTSLSGLKNVIVDRLSTHDTIITENDLNTWFATQAALLTDVNNSNITFKKETDNLLKRTFSAYLLLRDGVALDNYMSESYTTVSSSYISSLVPTNTIDITYNVNASNANNEIIKILPYSKITYSTASKNNIVDGTSVSATDYVYNTPFNIVLNKKYNKVSYFYLETDNTSELEFTDVSVMNNISIIPTQVEVFHTNPKTEAEAADNDYYQFIFKVSSDTEIDTKKISSAIMYFGNATKVVLDTSKLSFILDDDSDKSSDDAESTLLNYTLTVTAKYKDVLSGGSNSNQIKLGFGDIDILVGTKCKLGLTLVFEDNSFNGKMETIDDVYIFSALDDVMSSDIILNKRADGVVTSYIIKDVPVVANYWISSSINRKWFIRQLFVYINMLKANIDKLETSTFFNIKFRNTYGTSNYYNAINTQLRLSLIIHIDRDNAIKYGNELNLTSDATIYESLKNTIRDYIRVAVDNANAEEELVISKIIMKTQAAYYNFIKYIEFNGLNGTFNQYVKKLDTSDTSYPLEYFSLDNTLEKRDANDSTLISRLEKDITFVFE